MNKFKNIVREAFDRWENGDESYQDFLLACSPEERMGVVLSNLETQVGAGGFKQWVENGYCLEIPALIESLQGLPVDLAPKVINIVERIRPFVDFSADHGSLGGYLTGPVDLDELTELYDQFASDFMEQVENHFESCVAS